MITSLIARNHLNGCVDRGNFVTWFSETSGPSKQTQPQNVVRRLPIGALKKGLVVVSEP